jgi:hypothetical protein
MRLGDKLAVPCEVNRMIAAAIIRKTEMVLAWSRRVKKNAPPLWWRILLGSAFWPRGDTAAADQPAGGRCRYRAMRHAE